MASENRFPAMHIEDQMQLASQIGQPIEPFELVELLYSDPQIPHSSSVPSSTQQQVAAECKKAAAEYKCNLCDRSFKEASHFTNHKRGIQCQKSLQKRNTSKKGNNVASNSASLQKKRKANFPPFKPYECNVCGARFCDKGNVQLHLQKIHQSDEQLWCEFGKPSGYGCSLCDFWFSDKIQLKNHQQEHNNVTTQQNGTTDTFYGGGLAENSFIYINPPNNEYSSVPSNQGNVNAPLDDHIPMSNSLHDYPSQSQYNGSSYERDSSIIHVQSSETKATDKKNDSGLEKIKWHRCPECQLKFIEVINLELHIKRKHCEAANSVGAEIPANFLVREGPADVWKGGKNKSCVCNICGLNVAATTDMTSHLKNDHGVTDSDNGGTYQRRKLKVAKTSVEAKCDHCLATFSSTDAMLNHKSIQKFASCCGVCDYSSCSDTQVAIHIYSLHSDHLPGGSARQALPTSEPSAHKGSGNACSSCPFVADTGCSLAQHLECHGPLKIQCVKCCLVISSYEQICHHIHSNHSNQIAKVKVSSDSHPTITVFLTPGLVSAAALKCDPPAICGAKKTKLTASQIDSFVCSVCCVTMKEQNLHHHLLRHQLKNLKSGDVAVGDIPLCRDSSTVEFSCGDCSFSRKTPQPVVTHIQAVHLSGKLNHIRKLHGNKVESITSNVFTPPSSD